MASEDRSLKSGGISIPQWMKSRITENKFDLDQNTFSPPENDDNFLYIRYPQIVKAAKTQNVVSEVKIPCEVDYLSTGPAKKVDSERKQLDRSANLRNDDLIVGNPKSLIRSSTDIALKTPSFVDDARDDGTACGSSVVRVAHQMITGKYPTENPIDSDPLKPKGFQPMQRRGSRSLPASPQASPKTKRKLNLANKYFTGAFVDNENHSGGWILQGLLNKRELSQSIGLINEESAKSDLEKSFSDLHINEHKPDLKMKKEFKAKPSQYREMNFWSPTSM